MACPTGNGTPPRTDRARSDLGFITRRSHGFARRTKASEKEDSMHLTMGPWGLYDPIDHCWMSNEDNSIPAVYYDMDLAWDQAAVVNAKLGFANRIVVATIDLQNMQFKDRVIIQPPFEKPLPPVLRIIEE
jgi:hypothetical protein